MCSCEIYPPPAPNRRLRAFSRGRLEVGLGSIGDPHLDILSSVSIAYTSSPWLPGLPLVLPSHSSRLPSPRAPSSNPMSSKFAS